MDEEVKYVAKRLDQYVAEQLPELSRSFAAKLIHDGRVLVNAKQQRPGYKLRETDTVEIQFSMKELEDVPHIDIPVIYEDDDCVVINKPIGLLCHNKGGFTPEATVASWLREHVMGLTGERAGIVHRLDRATSGVMICAKSAEALSALQKQFSLRKTVKTYVALVAGAPKESHAIIDMPIGRNPKKPQTFTVLPDGKHAVTEYWVQDTQGALSILELKPVTGRTHQLRVHLKAIGTPIVGDFMYGSGDDERLFLHAKTLEITLPGGERKVFDAKLPSDFKTRLKRGE